MKVLDSVKTTLEGIRHTNSVSIKFYTPDNMSENEFEKSLKLTNVALLFSGIKMFDNRLNKKIAYFINYHLFYCNIIVLYAVIFGEFYWFFDGIQTCKPFVELTLTSPCTTISILATIKSLYLYLNGEILVRIVYQLKEIHPTIDDNEELEEIGEKESKIVTKSMKLFKLVITIMISVSFAVLMTFCFIPLILMGYNYKKTGELVVRYPYPLKYHFDVYKSEWWPLMYFHQVWATAIVAFNILGCDTLFYALCVYIDMHFRILNHQFENIMLSSHDETQRNLAKVVERHQEIIELVNQTEILYSKSSLVNIVTSSFLICLSAFNITVADEVSTIFAFVSFLVLSLTQVSLMCYFADILMRSSTEISDSVYKCPWYEADEDFKKTILLIIMRSQKSCRLTAWNFADLNLRAFTTILSRSWSYFALLKTVYK